MGEPKMKRIRTEATQLKSASLQTPNGKSHIRWGLIELSLPEDSF